MKRFLQISLIWLAISQTAYGAVAVSCQLVQTGGIKDKISFSGEVKPFAEAFVTPELAGRVEKVHVEVGQPVKSGEALITLDKDRDILAVKLAEIGLKISEQKVVEAQKDYARKKILYEKKVLNDKAFEEAETNYLNSVSYVKQAQAKLDLEKLNLDRETLRSPMNGFFVNRMVQPGQGVTPGVSLGRIIDLSKVYIEAKIPEHLINKVKIGQACLLETSHEGKVSFINLYGDDARSFLVKIRCENPDQKLKANMFVKGEILVEHFQNIPLIPLSAVITNGNNAFVFVEEGGKARKREVEILARDSGNCYARGVEVGENLIVEGSASLSDGSDLSIEGRGEKGSVSTDSIPIASGSASVSSPLKD